MMNTEDDEHRRWWAWKAMNTEDDKHRRQWAQKATRTAGTSALFWSHDFFLAVGQKSPTQIQITCAVNHAWQMTINDVILYRTSELLQIEMLHYTSHHHCDNKIYNREKSTASTSLNDMNIL